MYKLQMRCETPVRDEHFIDSFMTLRTRYTYKRYVSIVASEWSRVEQNWAGNAIIPLGVARRRNMFGVYKVILEK